MNRSTLQSLKRRQLAKSIASGQTIPAEKIGQRLRDIRESLGMTQKQLAKKLKISQSAVSQIEENILSCTIVTISKMANALNCDFLGALASRQPMEDIIKFQAEKTARKILNRTFANMAIEKQSPTKAAYNYQLKKLSSELAVNPGSELWED